MTAEANHRTHDTRVVTYSIIFPPTINPTNLIPTPHTHYIPYSIFRIPHIPQGRAQHVLVCGDTSSTSMREFLSELFHKDHANDRMVAVILQPGARVRACLDICVRMCERGWRCILPPHPPQPPFSSCDKLSSVSSMSLKCFVCVCVHCFSALSIRSTGL